jgi:hypothetical protein
MNECRKAERAVRKAIEEFTDSFKNLGVKIKL